MIPLTNHDNHDSSEVAVRSFYFTHIDITTNLVNPPEVEYTNKALKMTISIGEN